MTLLRLMTLVLFGHFMVLEANEQRYCLHPSYPCFYFSCTYLTLAIDINKVRAYKCPKGLVFNEDKQKCEWVLPWQSCDDKLVPPHYHTSPIQSQDEYASQQQQQQQQQQDTHSYLYNMLKNVHQKTAQLFYHQETNKINLTYLSSSGHIKEDEPKFKTEKIIYQERTNKQTNFTATAFDDLGEASQYAFIILPVKVPHAQTTTTTSTTALVTSTTTPTVIAAHKEPKLKIKLGNNNAQRIAYKKVCYVTNWSQYRPKPGYFIPEYIDPFLCTHLIYAFAYIDNVTLTVRTIEENDEDMYRRINSLKYKNPKLKTMLGIGGWNMESREFSAMVSEERSRVIFIYHAIKFLRRWSYDGIDLDWEFPADRGGRPQDKHKFTLFLRELREAINNEELDEGQERLLISAAVAAGKERIDIGYEVSDIAKELDFVNLMTFDYRGAWDYKTGLNAPLYGHMNDSFNEHRLNQDWSVNYWLSKGCPSHKLVLGLPAFGRTFTLANPHESGIGAMTTSNGTMGNFTKTPGFLSYYECCELRKNKEWTQVWLSQSKSNYMFNKDQWVSYDDIKSFHLRTAYVVAKKLGGMFIWSLDMDDHSGQFCGMGSYPLIRNSMSLLMDYLPDSYHVNDVDVEPLIVATGSRHLSRYVVSFSCFNKKAGIYRDANECDKYYYCNGVSRESRSYKCPFGMKFNMNGCYCDDDLFNFKCEQLKDTYCGAEQDLNHFFNRK